MKGKSRRGREVDRRGEERRERKEKETLETHPFNLTIIIVAPNHLPVTRSITVAVRVLIPSFSSRSASSHGSSSRPISSRPTMSIPFLPLRTLLRLRLERPLPVVVRMLLSCWTSNRSSCSRREVFVPNRGRIVPSGGVGSRPRPRSSSSLFRRGSLVVVVGMGG